MITLSGFYCTFNSRFKGKRRRENSPNSDWESFVAFVEKKGIVFNVLKTETLYPPLGRNTLNANNCFSIAPFFFVNDAA